MKENSLDLNDHWPDASTYPTQKRGKSQSNYAIKPRKSASVMLNLANIFLVFVGLDKDIAQMAKFVGNGTGLCCLLSGIMFNSSGSWVLINT